MGVLHGLILKALALGCKAFFVLKLIETFSPGVFAEYSMVLSIGIVFGHIFSFSCVETLAILIAGSEREAEKYLRIEKAIFIACVFLVLAALLIDSSVVYVLLAIACSMHLAYVSGCVRTISSAHYEWVLNIPPIIFVFICLIFEVNTLRALFSIYFLIWITAAHLILRVKLSVSECEPQHSLRVVSKNVFLHPSALSRTISNLLLLALMRALIIVPALFIPFKELDQISVSVAIAESIMGLLMVVVNRQFNTYCSKKIPYQTAIINSVQLHVVMLFLSAITLIIGEKFFSFLLVDFEVLAIVLVFFGSVISLISLRNYVWVSSFKIILTDVYMGAVLAVLFFDLILYEYFGGYNWLFWFVVVCSIFHGVTVCLVSIDIKKIAKGNK